MDERFLLDEAQPSGDWTRLSSLMSAGVGGAREYHVRLQSYDDGFHYLGHKQKEFALTHSRSYPKKDREPLFFAFKSRLPDTTNQSTGAPVYGPCDVLVYDMRKVLKKIRPGVDC